MSNSNRKEQTHVFYFEPNDIYVGKDQNGQNVPLTPYLEDMCVAMRLTADIFPRAKTCIHSLGEENKNIVKRSLSWISYVNDGTSSQIINNGVQMGSEKYLTTYYSEISADNYIENEMVEGLGITNITISYQSWMVPQITINFVDVHGSALWGREEAIHDSHGNLTASNILGVFFTLPYPLFRLQIKGFLGHDVTYQLSVSSFTGRYNSQTGNFEATATFIGYAYALLTDIPLHLLSYVSEMSYVGKKYWDEHIKDPKWQMQLADGTTRPPIPLYQLIQNIRDAVKGLDSKSGTNCDGTPSGQDTVVNNGEQNAEANDRLVSLDESSNVTVARTIKTVIQSINALMANFKKKCKTWAESNNGFVIEGSDNVKKQIVIILPQSNTIRTFYKYNPANNVSNIDNDIKTVFTSLTQAIEDYNKTYTNNNLNYNIQEENTSYSKATQISLFENNIYQQKLFKDSRTKIVKKIQQNKMPNSTVWGANAYMYVINFGNLEHQLASIEKKVTTVGENTETKIENVVAQESNSNEVVKNTSSDTNTNNDGKRIETRKKKIVDMIGFEPTIGNFIKLLMCHLETFVEVMMHCGDKIYSDMMNGKRKPSLFNLDLANTDIPTSSKTSDGISDTIWPWPQLLNPHPVSNSETKTSDSKYNSLGWTNDYPPKSSENGWEEQKVILSLLNAIDRYDEDTKTKVKGYTNRYSCIPMSCSDLVDDSIFSDVSQYCNSIENIAPYLGLRIANLIGVGDNQCDNEMAKAIGYMDALNLIGTNYDYSTFKKAIESKEGDKDFVTQVINYLTCKNNISQKSQSENGKVYNNFEFLLPDEGNVYDNERHPMFMESNGNGIYTYTYTYRYDLNSRDELTENIVSLVPTKLLAFTGQNNPYLNTLFTKKTNEKTKKIYFEQNINSRGNSCDASQWIVYNRKTLFVIPSNELNYHVNDNLFTVITDESKVNSILNRIKELKAGEIIFKDYKIEGENKDTLLKNFIDRRFNTSISDYYSIIMNEIKPHILLPLISTVNKTYYENNLCNSKEEANDDNIIYNNWWADDTNTVLYPKLELTFNVNNETFKNGNDEYGIEDVFIGELPVIYLNEKVSLFGSPIYYCQNKCDDNIRNKAKAYLLLNSMMGGVNPSQCNKLSNGIFKCTNKSLIDYLPPFYVYFIGALLWRKYQIENDKEPLQFDTISPIGDESSLIVKQKCVCGLINRELLNKIDNISLVYYTLDDYYMNYDEIDYAVQNKLIALFEYFAEGEDFKIIRENCELQGKGNVCLNNNEWEKLRAKWNNSTFDSSKPNNWKEIFSPFYSNYSSIIKTDSGNLRLLFNENNKAMNVLKELYGLGRGFIVSKATTNHVGSGDDIISVTSKQMTSYLEGFKQRIMDAKANSNKTVDAEISVERINVDRDYAASIYYSLKHLWDSWLVSCARDQFKVENFFDKYFIFIDSFYMNMYNTIKLNPQKILDCYSNKNINLLGYIDNVVKPEGCMLSPLPSFLDSNNMVNGKSTVGAYNEQTLYNVRAKEIKDMFTPLSFSDMGTPAPNNYFVFVYNHPYSSNACESTDKRYDSYLMTDETLPSCLYETVIDAEKIKDYKNGALNCYRKAYYLPCFGITVNRGGNHIFKSINVDMNSAKITSVAAQTYENILEKNGNDSVKKIYFHGQDIFNIYSQYAYTCEIEMMGCAQVQLLMYFSLLNIPMWRGTYQIYEVVHTMQPGHMSTKFKGIKMANYQTSYAEGYYTEPKKNATANNTANTDTDTSNDTSYNNCSSNDEYADNVDGSKGYIGGDNMINDIFNGEEWDITSHYGNRNGKFHRAIDIVFKDGRQNGKLYAPWDGVIIESRVGYIGEKSNGGFGGTVVLFNRQNKCRIRFSHLNKIHVGKGDTIKKGKLVGLMGNTGRTRGKTGIHLDMRLYINDKYVNNRDEVNPEEDHGVIR